MRAEIDLERVAGGLAADAAVDDVDAVADIIDDGVVAVVAVDHVVAAAAGQDVVAEAAVEDIRRALPERISSSPLPITFSTLVTRRSA